MVEDLCLGHHTSGIDHEIPQQRELRGREVDQVARARDLVRVLVESEIGVPEQPVVDVGDLVATQERAHSSDDLLETERLGDVVVAADGQPGHLVLHGVAGGEEEHRHVAPIGAQATGHLESVDVGHHHVEDEQVGLPVAREGQRLLPTPGRAYVESDELQSSGQQVGDVGLVVDNENSGLRLSSASVHAPSSAQDPGRFLGTT